MTQSMTRWTLAGFMALAALGAVAVLDVGSTTAEAAPSVSPFAGSWSGTWSIEDHPEYFGTYDWIAARRRGQDPRRAGRDRCRALRALGSPANLFANEQ